MWPSKKKIKKKLTSCPLHTFLLHKPNSIKKKKNLGLSISFEWTIALVGNETCRRKGAHDIESIAEDTARQATGYRGEN
jgi:hypothetical protein